jgi:hypothetical protein
MYKKLSESTDTITICLTGLGAQDNPVYEVSTDKLDSLLQDNGFDNASVMEDGLDSDMVDWIAEHPDKIKEIGKSIKTVDYVITTME